MATTKQLTALAKARAARTKKAAVKKAPAKKIAVTAKSRATGKPPTARLKARRKKNLTAPAGYYPNPLKTKEELEKAKAKVVKSRIKKAAADRRPKSYIVKVTKNNGAVGYYFSEYPRGKFDTDINFATLMTQANANKLATGIFEDFNRAVYKVEVIKKL